MLFALILTFLFICGACVIGCLAADRTEIGSSLAASVKGRPYIPAKESS